MTTNDNDTENISDFHNLDLVMLPSLLKINLFFQLPTFTFNNWMYNIVVLKPMKDSIILKPVIQYSLSFHITQHIKIQLKSRFQQIHSVEQEFEEIVLCI